MEIVSLVASAASVLMALGAISFSFIYYSRTSHLVQKNERTAHALEKSIDQVYVMLNKLSRETEEAYGKIESGVNQLAEVAQQAHAANSEPDEDLSTPPSVNGKHH